MLQPENARLLGLGDIRDEHFDVMRSGRRRCLKDQRRDRNEAAKIAIETAAADVVIFGKTWLTGP